MYRDVFLVRSVSLCCCICGGSGDLMSAFLVFTANTVLLILLVLFITYLVGRANDDGQWPQV